MTGSRTQLFQEVLAAGGSRPAQRDVAIEEPCAVEVNGLGYAVMMLTPEHLEDFAYGFCLSERLIDGAADIESVAEHRTDRGIVLRIATRPGLRERVAERVRHRISDSSCGLCGIENLEQALRPLPRVEARQHPLDPAAIFRALAEMRAHQPLNRATGAVHGACACGEDGAILLSREDVGRHNAFDKLIGAMLRGGADWGEGFALLSSRCSYELVEKAALAGCPTLVTISAPTTLAIARAAEAGVELITLARPDSFLTPADGVGGGEPFPAARHRNIDKGG
jgi:FdhD protein